MTLRLSDRYAKLKDEAFVRLMVVKSVQGSVILEKLYSEVKDERQLTKA